MLELLKSLKPYKWAIAATLTLIALQSLAQLYLPNLMSNIVDIGIMNNDIAYILKMGGFMLLVGGLAAACGIIAGYFSSRTSAHFAMRLRSRMFSRIESFALHEFDTVGTSSLITRTTNDVTQVQQLVNMMLRIMVRAPMMCIGGVIMAVAKDPKLSLVVLVAMPFLTGTIILISRKTMPLFRAIQQKIDKLNQVIREQLAGVRVVRAFNRNSYEERRFDAANRDLTSTAVRVQRIMAVMGPSTSLMMNGTIVAIIWAGGWRIESGGIQIGDLMAFIQYVTHIMFSLSHASMLFTMLPRAAVSADRINQVLRLEPSIRDATTTSMPQQHQRGYLEFRNVTFSYPGAEKPALENVSFRTGPGEVTAILGGTGSGKSTLVNLIPRFYDVDSGSILVDGVDIRNMRQEDLRARIGLVPQKALLFTGTIADNIRYGKEDATDEEMIQAAQTAQIADFIESLKEGYQTMVSQGGVNFSGGQKQRLAIARALVRKPEIYIFDDSFSALDLKTDARLRAALRKETKDSTVIVVAQRIGTVIDADRIIVLDAGKVAGIGTHRELLATCQVYREIAASQLSEEELAS